MSWKKNKLDWSPQKVWTLWHYQNKHFVWASQPAWQQQHWLNHWCEFGGGVICLTTNRRQCLGNLFGKHSLFSQLSLIMVVPQKLHTSLLKSLTGKDHLFIPAGKSLILFLFLSTHHEPVLTLLDRPINYSVLALPYSPLVFPNEPLTTSLSLSLSLFPCLCQPPIKAQEMMSSLQSPHDRQKERGGKSERARAK